MPIFKTNRAIATAETHRIPNNSYVEADDETASIFGDAMERVAAVPPPRKGVATVEVIKLPRMLKSKPVTELTGGNKPPVSSVTTGGSPSTVPAA
jgi:hypothetical protein